MTRLTLNSHFSTGFMKTAQLPPVDAPAPITPSNMGVWGARMGPLAAATLPASMLAILLRTLIRRKHEDKKHQQPAHVRLPFED